MDRNTNVFDLDINPVLESSSDEELNFLDELLAGTFSNFLVIHDAYKKHHPKHSAYADLIAKEICEYGGNSIANLFRGEAQAIRTSCVM